MKKNLFRINRRKGLQENSLTTSQIETLKEKPTGLQKPGEKLISIEVLEKGRVQPAVYLKYLRAAGILPIGIAMLAYWTFQTVSVFTNYWLTDWTQDPVLANRYMYNPDYLCKLQAYFPTLNAILTSSQHYLIKDKAFIQKMYLR
ncbi:multidrug resistance-associated protein 1 [Elysia marginata]|uniref:Multidrug resistance-associated protein 1 n=1 Tax=Elysia marginata TaxID=1093978 RepID=A0AAV4FEC5_9GAST|nr:multidrug resistance-associated protein 1 [Elysia marginata]